MLTTAEVFPAISVCTKIRNPFSVFKTNWNVLAFSKNVDPIHFCTVAATSDRINEKISYQVSQILVFEVLQISPHSYAFLDTYQSLVIIDDFLKFSMRMKNMLSLKLNLSNNNIDNAINDHNDND